MPCRRRRRNAHAVMPAAAGVTRAAAHYGSQYSAQFSASNFASLDALELDRLQAQLRSAYSWLDIYTSLDESSAWMVDEASVVAALFRLSSIYSHLG